MNLIERETGNKIKATIKRLSQSEINNLKNSKRFGFNWSLESNMVYGIKGKGIEDLLGLISLIDIPSEFRIHINLIESSLENQGKKKKFDYISGCLIGFACRLAFEKGYEGFVSLIPKTELVKYYHQKYGFIQIGAQMAVFLETSQSIIDKYLNNEKV